MYTFGELRNIFLDYCSQNNLVEEPKGLYEPVNYIMNIGGKRIRPLICLMIANFYNEDITDALPLAYSIEMFHNFTLVHDDMMDDADLRRNNETVHIKYDHNTAILSGDLMMIKSYDYLIKSTKNQIKKYELLELFTSTAIRVCEGQQYDMDFEKLKSVSTQEYLKMIEFKTAILLACCFKAGSIIGNASNEDCEHFYHYGMNLGLAFQIQDDFLDLYGDSKVFGKTNGGDIIQKKKTYLYVRTLELLKEKEQFVKLYNNDDIEPEGKIRKVLDVYNSLNIKEKTQNKINELIEIAHEHLRCITLPMEKLQKISDLEMKLIQRKQ